MGVLDFLKKKDKKTLDIEQYKEPVDTKVEKKKTTSSITIDPTSATRPEEYYDIKARFFGRAKFTVTGLLIVFIILVFTIFSDVFTAENFKYLIKHINVDNDGVIDDFRTVVYSDTEGISFGDFKQDFVIAAPGVLKLYDYNGGVSLFATPATKNPKLCISDKYLLLYDEGDRDFYIYNNFSLLYSGECEGNIISADMSDEGVFVISSESIGYSAHIYVYNENFELIREIKKTDPVTEVKLSNDGGYLALMSTSISALDYISAVNVYELKGNTAVISENIHSEVPVSVEFEVSDNDVAITVLTDKSLHRYTYFGEEGVKNLEKNNVLLFSIGERITAYLVKDGVIDNSSTLICVENKDMEEKYITSFDEKVLDVKVWEDFVYVLTKTTIIKIDEKGGLASLELRSTPKGMVVFSSGEVFVRYANTAELAVIE